MRLVPVRRAGRVRMPGMVLYIIGLAGCGVLGSPIPPEDVGVSPVVERQLRRDGLLSPGSTVRGSASRPMAPSGITVEQASIPPEARPLPTPTLREMGTR